MGRRALAVMVALVVGLLAAARIEAQPVRPYQISVNLVPGWNNIGYVGQTRPYVHALASLSGRVESVWTWDTHRQRWLGANPLMPGAGDFTEMRQFQAYWIRMSGAGEIIMDVPATQPTVSVGTGWNNFVFPGPEQPVAQALGIASTRYAAVWRWDAGRQGWNGFDRAVPHASDFTTLGPNRSYFVRLTDGPPIAFAGSTTAFSAPVPNTTPGVVAAVPTATPAAAGSGMARRGCHPFQSYQPQLQEVSRAHSRAAFGALTQDADYRIKELETQQDGSGGPTQPYIPPTLLKAVGWIESNWRQATQATARGSTGPTITSSSCAYGLMQLLTGMDINGTPTSKQQRTGSDYISNVAAGAQMLGIKWNLAPEYIPVVQPRNPRTLEDWYYAVWAYHCFGDVCESLSIHNNPDDPALKWPRPMYNSPDQLSSSGQFSFGDYPYQELVYGIIAHPPKVNNTQLWSPLPVKLPSRGTVGFPEAKPFQEPAATTDPTAADAP